MALFEITRFHKAPEYTLGLVSFPTGLTLTCLELGWKWNKRFFSCIPEGRYFCRILEPSPDNLMRVRFTGEGVAATREGCLYKDDRYGIDAHIGNSLLDTKGCPLFGTNVGFETQGKFYGEPRVNSSRAAMELFHEWLRDNSLYPDEGVAHVQITSTNG